MAHDTPDILIIDPAFKALIPPLSEDEYGRLERKLLKEGCTEPLKAWPDGDIDYLIDGHHRYEICEKHGIHYEVVHVQLADRKAVVDWMIENQLGRRNITDFVKVELAAKLHGWIVRVSNETLARGKTDIIQQIADTAGASRATVARALAVLRNGTADTIDLARKGKVSINQAYQAVRGLPDGMAERMVSVNMECVEKLRQAESISLDAVHDAEMEIMQDKAYTGAGHINALLYRWESLRQQLYMTQQDDADYEWLIRVRNQYHRHLFGIYECHTRDIEHGYPHELDRPYTMARQAMAGLGDDMSSYDAWFTEDGQPRPETFSTVRPSHRCNREMSMNGV